MSDATPLVSVILPTYNRASVLRRALGSILAQTYRNLDVIVVDDGSSDDTEGVVRGMGDARVRYIRKENRGPGAARNAGIVLARGELIAFQDSDDEWLPEKIAKQVARLQAAPAQTGVVVCGHRELRPDAVNELTVDARMARGDTLGSLLTGLWYITPTWLVRRSALDRAGPFDEHLPSCEDHDLAFRLHDVCSFAFVPEVLVVKHHTSGSVYDHLPSRVAGFRTLLWRHRHRWRRSPFWLARHEFMIGYWLLTGHRQRWLGFRYMLQAAWHHPRSQRRAVLDYIRMDLYHHLPYALRVQVWRLPAVQKFVSGFQHVPPPILPKKPTARVFSMVPLDPHFPNGFSARWFHFVRALAERFDVEVVAVRGIWHERTLPDDAFRPPLALARFQVVDAVPFPRIPTVLLYRLGLLLDNLNTLRFGPRLAGAEAVFEPQPDVAIFCTHYLAHLAARFPPEVACVFLLEEGMVRTLYTNQPPIENRIWRRTAWRNLMQFLSERRYRKVVARCGRRGPVVAISEEERDWLARAIPDGTITVVPNGLDPAEYAPLPLAADHDVAIFGDLGQARNFVPASELVKRALSRPDTRHLRWLLVGKAPSSVLSRLSGERVTLTGYVDDTRPYYARARTVVIPARLVTGSKSTLLKAWAMQRPAVTTPAGTAGVPARDGDNVLVADTHDAMLDRVLELLADPARADALARAGRETLVNECSQAGQAATFAGICADALSAAECGDDPRRVLPAVR
ncbi:MAG TPA: glycosyltransferase [Verrucomicrobiae bacterium]|nr:glycosyltransferase [Verrucomicrobiae bacterium]